MYRNDDNDDFGESDGSVSLDDNEDEDDDDLFEDDSDPEGDGNEDSDDGEPKAKKIKSISGKDFQRKLKNTDSKQFYKILKSIGYLNHFNKHERCRYGVFVCRC